MSMTRLGSSPATASVYSAIAIGLVEEFGFTPDMVNDLFVYTQGLWAECAKKNISMVQWAKELTNIEILPFISEKAKAGGK